jgi:chaperonin GroES
MKLRPLADRLVVKPLEGEDKTSGGIVLPDTAKEKPTKGKVISVGPGKLTKTGEHIPIPIRTGDTILFSKYSGNEIKIDGTEYKIISESEVLAVIE